MPMGGGAGRLARADVGVGRSLETLNRRKLLLACLMMRRPRVMLLDEPAAGLINAEIDELDGSSATSRAR